MILKYVPLYACIFLFGFDTFGQTNPRQSQRKSSGNTLLSKEVANYTLSLRSGLTQFYGELNKQDMRGMVGLGLSRNMTQRVSVGLEYTAGKLGGENSNFFNSYFVNKYNTFEMLAKWNLTEQFRNRRKKRGYCDFSVYGGVGLMVFNANAYDLKTDKLVRFTNSAQSARNPLFLKWGPPKGPAGIRNTREGILPLGMTLDYELLDRWLVGLDFRFYFARTDKADATSGQRLTNPEESESYSDTPNDKFSLLAVSVTHLFGKRIRKK
jgi:hypothetical protein